MTRFIRLFTATTALSLSLATIAAAEDLTLRYLASHGGLSAHELAQELGYFEGKGLKLENLGYAQGGPASLVGLAGGSLEIGSSATSAVVNSIAGGNDFIAAYPSNGISAAVQSVFYVLEDSPLKDVKDIVGKTIAVNTLGAHLDYTVREALHQQNQPLDSANLLVVPGPQLEQVLRSGQVDVSAFGYWQTTFEGVARKNGGLRPLFDDTDVLGEISGGFIVLRRDWVEAHPEQTKAFVEGSAKALEFARENLDETREIFARILAERGENPELAQFFLGYGVREGGLATARDMQFWIDVLEREGAIPAGKVQVKDVLYGADSLPATN